MQNFVLHNPTTIIFGTDTVKQIGPETAALGRKVLLVYGRGSIRRHGIYEQVVSSLRGAGLEITDHGGVQPNPLLSHVRAGISTARANGIEAVVAVGGGSVIDTAKAIAAGVAAEHDVWQFFRGKKSIRRALPLTCVLTLAAAGSEMNGGMVITNEQSGHKFGIGSRLLNPRVSILDPTLTFTVPADYTAYGAVDAIAHILEFYFTTRDPATPVQDRFMEGLVSSIMASCDRVLQQPRDYQGRADLMWAATLALNGWTAAGLGRVGFPMHMIAHSFSALYNTVHGAALSVVMPAWMGWQARLHPAKFSQFGQRVFGLAGSPEQCALAGIARLRDWFARINCPVSLAGLGIAAADIPRLADNALPLARLWRLQEYDRELIERILRECG
jgi:hypothetical protein